jgi:hypothetical protein
MQESIKKFFLFDEIIKSTALLYLFDSERDPLEQLPFLAFANYVPCTIIKCSFAVAGFVSFCHLRHIFHFIVKKDTSGQHLTICHFILLI